MTRFLHTSDWQLGMTRHYLSPRAGDDPQARFTADRIEAVRRLGEVARQQGCEFVVVAGDVFETQNVSAQIRARACEAMESISLPTYLLPGNHDSLEPGCIWDQPELTDRLPSNVHVLRDTAAVRQGDVEIIGVPLQSRHVDADPVAPVLAGLEADGTTRVLVAHGQLAGMTGNTGEALLSRPVMEQAVAEGVVAYVALGDRHIADPPDDPHAAVRHSGTHETTSFTEPGRGVVLVVDLGDDGVTATEHEVGTWLHTRVSRELTTDADLEALDHDLSAFDRRDRTIVRYDLHGAVTLTQKARLDALLARHEESFASLEASQGRHDLKVIPDDRDLADVDLPSWARAAYEELSDQATTGDTEAAEALTLLLRLTLPTPTTRADS